jgi:nucleotide-binding universal stress UspA family protein
MKRNLLFVTSQEENCEAGLSYALDLAKMMDKGVSILLVRRNRLLGRFEAAMSAVTFAEANEHDTARQIVERARQLDEQDVPALLRERCSASGMAVRVYTTLQDTVSALRDFLRDDGSVELVLLSPSITEEPALSTSDFRKLLRSATRPVVTMARQAHGA